jgi:hypothetical protein
MSEADKFDAEEVVGGTSETVADGFDAEVVVGANWFTRLFKKAAKAAADTGQAYLTLQAQDGSQVNATPDAVKKAAEMIDKARSGDAVEQAKVVATAALGDQGDPAAKQATTLLSFVNDYAKQYGAKSGTATAGVGVGVSLEAPSVNADLDVEAYDWGW